MRPPLVRMSEFTLSAIRLVAHPPARCPRRPAPQWQRPGRQHRRHGAIFTGAETRCSQVVWRCLCGVEVRAAAMPLGPPPEQQNTSPRVARRHPAGSGLLQGAALVSARSRSSLRLSASSLDGAAGRHPESFVSQAPGQHPGSVHIRTRNAPCGLGGSGGRAWPFLTAVRQVRGCAQRGGNRPSAAAPKAALAGRWRSGR